MLWVATDISTWDKPPVLVKLPVEIVLESDWICENNRKPDIFAIQAEDGTLMFKVVR